MKINAYVLQIMLVLTLLATMTATSLQAQEGIEPDAEMSTFDRKCLEVLQKIVANKLPRDLYMASLDTIFFGLRGAEIKRFQMTENADFRKSNPEIFPFFAAADHIMVHINPLPLLVGQVLVTNMQADNPVLQIVRDEENNFNFDDLTEAQDSKLIKWLHVNELYVNDAVLRVLDKGTINKPIRYVINDVDVAVRDFQIGEAFSVDLRAASPGSIKQNVLVKGQAGPMELKQKNEEIPFNVDFQAAKVPVTPYNRYIFPENSPIVVISGNANVDFHMAGDLWSGLAMSGILGIENLVLQSTKDAIQGEPISVRLNVQEPMALSLKKDRLNVPGIELVFNGNKFLISGSLSNLGQLPEADVDVRTGDVNIDVINEVYPFIYDALPVEGLTMDGHLNLNMHLSGTQESAKVNGYMDLTKFSMGFEAFFRKPPQTLLFVDFEGLVSATEIIEGRAVFNVEHCLVGHYNVIEDILKHLLAGTPNRVLKKRLLESYHTLPLHFETMNGEISFKEDRLYINNVRMTELSAGKMPGIDVVMNGEVDFITSRIDIKSNATVSTGLTRKILMAAPETGRYLDGEQLVLGFQHAGTFDNFKITIFAKQFNFPSGSAQPVMRVEGAETCPQ